MYTVSVIMPVYNNEKTLEKAIESILNQKMYSFELIIVNDGSTDTSAQICEKYEKMEPLLIEVIHQNKKGFAAARNKGLSIAKGKYIYFANAYDLFDKRMLQSNVSLAEDRACDLVVFGYTVRDEKSPMELEQYLPSLPYLPNQERFRNHYRNFHHFSPYVLANKLYRRSNLMKNRLKFVNVPHSEEAFFNLALYKELDSVAFNRVSFIIQPIEYLLNENEYKENIFEVNIKIAEFLRAMVTYWGLGEEFEDVILYEYFYSIYAEVLAVCSDSSPLTLKEQEQHIDSVLKDKRITPHLKKFNKIKVKSPYKLALLSIIKNGNGKAAIQIVKRTNDTKATRSKIVGIFNKIFR